MTGMNSVAPIPFIDAHAHLWDLGGAIRYPWLTPPFRDDGPSGGIASIAHDYLLSDYLMDARRWNVKGFVHVDAAADPAHALDETKWLEDIAAEAGMPNAIIAFAPLHDPNVESLLKAQAAHAHVRGVRNTVNWHPDPSRSFVPRDLTQDDRWRHGFGLLGRYGLSFDLQCYPGQMQGLAPLIERHPEIPVVIDHLGMPVATDPDGFGQWRKGLKALAALPHVAIKLSGVGFIYRDWTTERIRPLLLEVIDLFGVHRCLFASDFPTDKLFASFDRHLDAYHEIVADFSEDELHSLFSRNTNRIYRLGIEL